MSSKPIVKVSIPLVKLRKVSAVPLAYKPLKSSLGSAVAIKGLVFVIVPLTLTSELRLPLKSTLVVSWAGIFLSAGISRGPIPPDTAPRASYCLPITDIP